jgi:hypothetical protein
MNVRCSSSSEVDETCRRQCRPPHTAQRTAYLTDTQQGTLYTPDVPSHLPFIVTMLVAVVVLHLALGPERRAA